MLGLTSLGIIHTAISLVALGTGTGSLIRDQEIRHGTRLGRWYTWTTVLTCLTGFPIMQHGGFGKPHALGLLTLVVLGIAVLAGSGKGFGRFGRHVETVAYSATFLFHLIPGVVETTTRIPPSAPWVRDREGPELQAATVFLFLAFLIGATLQVVRLRRTDRVASAH